MQIQQRKNAFVERAGLLYTREMLAVSFDRLASHFVLVVGREIHAKSFLIAPCLVCGTYARANLNGEIIASLHSKSLILGRPDPSSLREGVATPD